MRFPWQRTPPSSQQIIEEYLDCLRLKLPEVRVEEHSDEEITISSAEGEKFVINPEKPLLEVGRLRKQNLRERQKIYEKYLQALADILDQDDESLRLSPDDHSRVLPHVVLRQKYELLQSQASDRPVPHRPFSGPDFTVLYVIDFENNVRYITHEDLQELELDEPRLYDLALANARAYFPKEDVRSLLPQPDKISGASSGDLHNSAMLLVLPEYLEPAEEWAVMLPDEETVYIAPVPKDNNWNPLREIARSSEPSYIHQPMLVTPQGIRMM